MQTVFLRHRAAPLVCGAILLLTVTAALVATGAFTPDELPAGFSSSTQLLGINLLLILVPAYIVAAAGILLRRSHLLLGRIDSLLPEGQFQDRVRIPRGWLLAGTVIGALYAIIFNLPIRSLDELLEGPPLLVCLVGCMVLVWICVGLLLSSRLYVSGLFLAAGRVVPIDLWRQERLEPFARNGMSDMLMAVGGLVLTTVQSIDATIRYQNYLFSLAVVIPAALVLLVRPMLSVHQRLKAARDEELKAVNEQIDRASKALSREAVAALEPWLQRRERIRSVTVWPLNLAMLSRLLFYGIIPPVAWIAVAIVEQLVEQALVR